MSHTITSTGALRACLFTLLVLAIGCRPRGPDEARSDTIEQAASTEAVLDEIGQTAQVSESTAEPAEQLVLRSRTPAELAPHLDPAAANLLVDLAALRGWAGSIPGVSSPEQRVASLVSEALATEVKRILEIGGTPEVTIESDATTLGISFGEAGLVVVSDGVLSGEGGRVTQTADGHHRLEFGAPATGGAALPVALPSDAFFTAWAPRADAFPAAAAGSLDFLSRVGAEGIGVGVRGDGGMIASVDGDLDAISAALGRGQAFASQMVGQLNGSAAPEIQPWVTYANRVIQSLFAQISLMPREGGVVLRVEPPRCGGPMRGVWAAALLITLADAAAEDARTAPRPFITMDGFLADSCDVVLEGPVGGVPTSTLRIASDAPGAQSLVAVLDLAALMRRGLPRGFGLLPFALQPEMLESVFAGRPLGLRGIDDSQAHIIFASERTAGSGAPVHRAILLPSGMRTFLPPDSGIDTMRPVPMVEHVAFVNPSIPARDRLGSEPGAHWLALHESLPEGAYGAILLGPGLVRPWSDWLGLDDPAFSWVSEASGAVLWLSPDGIGARLVGVAEAPEAVAVREHLPTLLGRIHRGVDSDARAAEREDAIAMAVQQLTVRTTDDAIELTLVGDATAVIGAIVRVGLPLITGRDGRRVGIPGAFRLPR